MEKCPGVYFQEQEKSCGNYREIKLMSHNKPIGKSDFMPENKTTDEILALRMFLEEYRESQHDLHCVFVDLVNDLKVQFIF